VDGMTLIDRTVEMTSNSTPSPFAVIATSEWPDASYYGFRCFDNHVGAPGWSTAAGVSTATIKYDFGSALWAAIGYSILGGWWNVNVGYCPKDFEFFGSNNDSTWISLDVHTGISDWTENDRLRSYTFTNVTKYRYYKWDITNNFGSNQINIEQMTILSLADAPLPMFFRP
jgi:hypothetical protein